MSETCIVCLGDLGENANSSTPPPVRAFDAEYRGAAQEQNPLSQKNFSKQKPSDVSDFELIARLLPCGHNLHDGCLKPWVERANSCPICRQNFHKVELSTKLDGPIISSYAVTDRVQVADVDPSLMIEEIDDLDSPPCPKCGNLGDDDILLLCDGCDAGFHLFCVELDSEPEGQWFCDDCALDRRTESSLDRVPLNNNRASGRTTRAQLRRSRYRAQTESSNWARVWQQVWDRLNVDLDFPYHDNSSAAQTHLSHRMDDNQRREFQEWERRFEVAERQGGTNRFRDAASALLLDRSTSSRHRPEPPEPESVEEILAWNALEKARDIYADPTPRARKRKSATNSPSEAEYNKRRKKRTPTSTSPTDPAPAPEAERPLKRPQTRRIYNNAEGSNEGGLESSNTRRRTAPLFNSTQNPEAAAVGNGPSFLQSLLKEVESSAAPDESKGHTRPLPTLSNAAVPSDYPSPRYSSPGASPTASNHPTPRPTSTTPPPSLFAHPGSPLPLTSKVEPIYPPPEFCPERSPSIDSGLAHRINDAPSQSRDFRQSRSALRHAPNSSPPRSEEASPSRANMSLSTKSDIQKMVKDALKTPYKNKEVSKDEYTEINRNVSRMLYDKVGGSSHLDREAAGDWRKLAGEAVAKAVQSLRGTPGT